MSPIPMLAILSTQTLVDGVPVDEPGLEATLNAKQALHAMLGGEPIREIVVQVGDAVSDERVDRFLERARRAGFVNTTRLGTADQQVRGKHATGLGERRPTSR
jgi:hypothetical protein